MARVWIAFALAAALLLSWARLSALEPHRQDGILPIQPPTPYFHFEPRSAATGRVLLIHGLDASKDFMQLFAAALADAGFEVFAIDLPGHGESPVAFSAPLARAAVIQAIDHIGKLDAVVGHSLGAGLLLDIANERPLPRMVLVSPAPTPVSQADLSRTLIITGGLDIPAINSFAATLEGVEWWRLPWAAHSTPFFNVTNTLSIIHWLRGRQDGVQAAARLRWHGLLLFSALGLWISLLPPKTVKADRTSPTVATIVAQFVLTGAAALLILRFVPLMHWLRIFATDYIVAVLFAVGVILCAVEWRRERFSLSVHNSWTPYLVAGLAAAYVIVVVGFIGAGGFLHFSLDHGRWWRFLGISAAGFPLFMFDEMCLRLRPTWNAVATAILTRALIGICILVGVLTLNRESAFLVLVIHLLALYWVALWFLTEIVRRHTQHALAAALFAAVIQGWCFAAWFVKI